MQILCWVNGLRLRTGCRSVVRLLTYSVSTVLMALSLSGSAVAQGVPLVLERAGRVIALEPYAPNILHITLSNDRAAASSAPGCGFVAQPSAEGWAHERDQKGYEVYRSARIAVRLAPEDLPKDKRPQPMPLDALNLELRQHYFGGGAGDGPNDGGLGPHDDALQVTAKDGKTLLQMRTWSMQPESPEVAQADAGAKGYQVASTFDSPADEHYYGLGQQQKGWMDLRDHQIRCWHDYVAIGGQDICVPFMVSSRGYGLVWDNPSKTTVDLGFNGRNVWSSEVGNRVSYFIIVGDTSDEIYAGYRLLTGVSHLLPRAIYGYIQSKAIYPTQEQTLDVAKEYRRKNLPLDVMVVDFLNMTKQGEMDLDPKRWPDPAAMNRELHGMGVGTLLSVWPHFAQGTQFYDMLLSKGWLIHAPDGKPDSGGFQAVIGPNLDTTNPEAAGVPGVFCTSRNATNWYGRSLRCHGERSTQRSRL
jgi:alpha-D-xyloside xylohydrolase